MPVGAYAGANVSNGNGVTTLFPYNFKILDQTHLEVKVDGVLKVLGADYTVTGVGLSVGGNVIFGVAPANATVVQRARKVPYKRDQDYQNNGDFKEVTVDNDLDTLAMQVQQVAADAARAFKAPLSVTNDQVIADADWAAAAGKFLRRKNDGSGIEFIGASPDADTFTATGLGAIARAWSAKVGELVSVKDFGAAGDGVADDTVAITKAIAASKFVFFPAGTYKVTATIDLPNESRSLFGFGTLTTAAALVGGGIFRQQNRGVFFQMEGLDFTGKTPGFKYNALDLPGGPLPFGTQYLEYSIRLCRFLQDATSEGIYLYGSREGHIVGCYFETCKGLYQKFAIETRLINCDFKNCARNVFSDVGSEGLRIISGSSLGATIGLEATQNASLTINGALWDYADQNAVIKGCTEVMICGAYLGTRTSNPAVEFALGNAVRCQRVKIVGSQLVTNYNNAASYALLADSVDHLTIADCDVWNWQAVGIQYSNCTDVDIHDSNISPKAGTGTYSVSCITAQNANDQIHHNYLGKPVNGITNKLIERNTGGVVITENGGTDTVANATTSKVVNHGLSFTPDPQNIDVIFVQQGTNNYGRWWIGNITATQFTVFVTADPGAGGVAFYWKARVRA